MTTERAYPDLETLLGAHLAREEHAETAALIQRLAPAAARGHLTYDELFAICCWKETRQRMRRHWQRNREPLDAPLAETASRRALATSDERLRMLSLTQLHGVGIPIASAILTILAPERYGVLDIRAWQVLHHYGAVATNPEGRGFSLEEWIAYLEVIRDLADRLGVGARRVEHALYRYHWETRLTKIAW